MHTIREIEEQRAFCRAYALATADETLALGLVRSVRGAPHAACLPEPVCLQPARNWEDVSAKGGHDRGDAARVSRGHLACALSLLRQHHA